MIASSPALLPEPRSRFLPFTGGRKTTLGLVVVGLAWVAGSISAIPGLDATSSPFPVDRDPICRPVPQGGDQPIPTPPGTARMIEHLRRVRREAERHPDQNVFVSSFLAARLRARLDDALAAGNSPRVLDLRPKLARQLLNAGETEPALQQYLAFRKMVDAASWRLDYRQSAELAFQTALCWMRLGEQENCLAGHHPESCLLPIRGGGVHREKRGSLGALELLRPHLETH